MACRILIVEDNPTNLELMGYLLRSAGHDVLTAADGVDGLELAFQEHPDVILMDLQMPRLDGYQAARQLKAHALLRETPLIAVTALAMVGDRERVLAAGFDGYISKPISPERFTGQVIAFLEARHTVPTPGRMPEPRLSAATLLMVDNAPANLAVVRGTLEPLGYRLNTASDVTTGLALAERLLPHLDLILSDIHLPGRDGFDLIRAVRTHPRLRAVPVAFISSTIWAEADRQTALSLGAVGFILRPIEPAALLAAIDGLLRPPVHDRGLA